MSPAAAAGAAASAVTPSWPAARHTTTGSWIGSAAAASNSSRVAVGSGASCRPNVSSVGSGGAVAPGSPNPPARSPGVSSRATSSSALGLPRVSATIRSRTRSSSGPVTAASSRARASASASPRTTSSVGPARSGSAPPERTAITTATGPTARWRATNASACAEARSSHCASSTTQTSGRSPATSASRPRTARPTAKRSGASPPRRLNAVPSASRCGSGSRSSRSRNGAHS